MKVHNRSSKSDFYTKVLDFVDKNREYFDRVTGNFLEEGIEIYIVDNMREFVEYEFRDIEKLRIFGRQLIREELPYINAIAIFDKIIVEEHDNFELSIKHAVVHGVFETIGEINHSTENHLALKFYRELIVRSLIKLSKGQNISEELKKVENTYLALLSGLKHRVVYGYLKTLGYTKILDQEQKFIENIFRERDVFGVEKLKLLVALSALEYHHYPTRIEFSETDEAIIEIVNEQIQLIQKHKRIRDRIEVMVGATIRVYTFLKKVCKMF